MNGITAFANGNPTPVTYLTNPSVANFSPSNPTTQSSPISGNFNTGTTYIYGYATVGQYTVGCFITVTVNGKCILVIFSSFIGTIEKDCDSTCYYFQRFNCPEFKDILSGPNQLICCVRNAISTGLHSVSHGSNVSFFVSVYAIGSINLPDPPSSCIYAGNPYNVATRVYNTRDIVHTRD